MDLRRVRRLAEVLLASELRSGRSLSNPKSLLGRPWILAIIDVAAFLGVFGLAYVGLGAYAAFAPGAVDVLADQVLLFLPVLAISIVLVAGVMFEFSTTARFGSSDAANWLPISPREYVTASSAAVAFVYSSALAFGLGAGLALALVAHQLPTFALAAALSVVALLEGAVLIEMLRSATQRASTVLSGRRGKVVLVARAAVFVVVILIFELVFNPVLLLGFLGALASFGELTAAIPLFWATRALLFWEQGAPGLAAAFALAQVAFVVLLFDLAARLRVRFWAPAAVEVRLEAHAFGARHPGLAAVGLSPAESAVVWKDLTGLTRRREMLPFVVTPIVIALIGYVQAGPTSAGSSDPFFLSFWPPWAIGFFAIMLSITSVGQERRAILGLLASPFTGRNLFRAKAAASILLGTLLTAILTAVSGLVFHLPPLLLATSAVVGETAVALGTLTGLAVATRYPDFQERPRPQYVRPGAMIAGMLGGFGLIFLVAVPATLWAGGAHPFTLPALPPALVALGAAGVAGPLLFGSARRGAAALAADLPT